VAREFDLVVLGSGSAARDGARMAAQKHGAHVALVESTRFGGSCPNVACRPTKAYLVVADLLHDVTAHAADWGVDLPAPVLDLARTRAWKQTLLRPQESWQEVLEGQGFGVFGGEAAFVDESTVRVGGEKLTAERILVATGGRTAVPPIPGLEDIEWLDHVSALELTEVPESLLVVGGGPVGLEFAQIFARFGSRVTIVNRGQIAARADADAAAELRAALEDEGIEVVVDQGLDAIARNGAELEAALGGRKLVVSHALLASGRSPNVEGLALEHAGVEATRGGITVDLHQRTSARGIWAAGDVAAGPQFTPTAQYQARIAVDDMFGNGSRAADYSVLPTAIFTDPELAGVGLTEAEAREQTHAVGVVTHPLAAVTRAQYTASKRGLCKIVYDTETRRVLGVHLVSRGASDIVGALGPALELGVTVDRLAAVHHVYPSYSEIVKAAAEKA
jgi:pyruvate/2-oxoglutarate dehydrogenase complex dihydrolipoamide dehydrogenase (E3) component